MKSLGLWLLLTLGLLTPFTVSAQDTDSCPANVLLALARAGSACSGIGRNEACYGNGAVEASFLPGFDDVVFDLPGHRISVSALQQLRVGGPENAESGWSVAMLQAQANLTEEREGRGVIMLLFGKAEIENLVPPTPEIQATATGTLNIRALPDTGADIIERVGLRETVMANGRTEDGDWLRVILPDSNDLGWASMQVIEAESDISTLYVVDETTPFLRPFQQITLSTGSNDAPCESAPNSGVLIQTPDTSTEVELSINGLTVRLAATTYIQAQAGDVMTISVLDGQVETELSGVVQFIPAGARALIPLSGDLLVSGVPAAAEPYTEADMRSLPVNNLGYRFSIPPALTQSEIDDLVTEWAVPEPTATPEVELTVTPTMRCRRTAQRAVNLWAGPGIFYEVVAEIDRGDSVSPVLQTIDSDDNVWWQLDNGHWIQAGEVEISGNCNPVPTGDVVQPPPYNYLTLETCESHNGPLRAGQQVEIEFVPPGWDTLADAQSATRVDPGRVTIDDTERLYTYASRPIRIGDERYILTFTAHWTATPGTHRIVGERLSYILICDVTVPVG